MNHEHSGASAPAGSTPGYFADVDAIRRGYVQLHRPTILLCRKQWKRSAVDAALVLERLRHWQSEGHDWVFKTDADWEEEAFISADQAHHILKRMVELGWVETHLAPRPFATKRYPVTWYRMNVEAIERSYAETLRDIADGSPELSAMSRSNPPRHRGESDATRTSRNRDIGTETMNRDAGAPGDARADSGQLALDGCSDRAASVDEAFEAFWQQYPKRNGRKLGKNDAQKAWRRLSAADRQRAMANLGRYKASGITPKDAFRWLRPEQAGGFTEYDVEAEPDRSPTAVDKMAAYVTANTAERFPGRRVYEAATYER